MNLTTQFIIFDNIRYLCLPAIIFTLTIAAIGPNIGLSAYCVLFLSFVSMLGIGRLCCQLLKQESSPLLALVVGFVVLSHALLASHLIWPGAHWQVMIVLLFAGLFQVNFSEHNNQRTNSTTSIWFPLLISTYTWTWCADITPRLNNFWETGKLSFWVDMFVHAGTIAHFGSIEAANRGMISMADSPALLYHYASYMIPAMLTYIKSVQFLEAALLLWMPLGILIMAAGVSSLGFALGGIKLAVISICGLSLLPLFLFDLLNNGLLNSTWILETAPATAYSIGISCGAIITMITWMRKRSFGSLILSLSLMAGCFFVRFNVFMWLAPSLLLFAIMGWREVSASKRFYLIILGYISLAVIFYLLSWQRLQTDPFVFMYSYIGTVLSIKPQLITDMTTFLIIKFGMYNSLFLGICFVLLGILGWWLPLFISLATLNKLKGRLQSIDLFPFILMSVAAIAIVMAPIARNGDITEFRHRPGPLLSVIIIVWTLSFSAVVFRNFRRVIANRTINILVVISAAMTLTTQYFTVSTAKKPSFNGSELFYDTSTSLDLIAVTSLLENRPGMLFVVADQPADTRVQDDAARIIALTGIPAYISCPEFLMSTGGQVAEEAMRRMRIIEKLKNEKSIEAFHESLSAEKISYYVVQDSVALPFDPEKRLASYRSGSFSVYGASIP